MKRSNIYGVVAAAAVILLSVALISWYLTKRSPMLIQGTVELHDLTRPRRRFRDASTP